MENLPQLTEKQKPRTYEEFVSQIQSLLNAHNEITLDKMKSRNYDFSVEDLSEQEVFSNRVGLYLSKKWYDELIDLDSVSDAILSCLKIDINLISNNYDEKLILDNRGLYIHFNEKNEISDIRRDYKVL